MLSNNKIVSGIDKYLFDQRLDSEMLLRKRWAWIWMMVTFVGSVFSVILFLFVLKLWPLKWVGFAFLAGYVVALPLYRSSKRFDLVINLLFSYFILIIFFAILQVGGLPSNLGYIFIGLNCALGSVLAGNLRWTIFLFLLYCSTILAIGVMQPHLTTPDYIKQETNTVAFVTLALWINACILLLMLFFIKDHERFEKAESDQLKKLDKEKTRLYTNISHEFRTPLTVIQGIANQIENQPEKWVKKGPGKIKEQGQILLHLVNQMLDISKLETGSLQLKNIHGNITEYVRYVANSFLGLAENKELALKVTAKDNPVYTDYDPDKLLQVLTNLISNSIKFTPAGGMIRVEINRLAKEVPETVEIRVIDTGQGISEQDIRRIFDRFYQVSDKNLRATGTGLGLAITKELVKLMKGEIRVQSEVGKGSEFIISLPITEHAPEEKDNGISKLRPVDLTSAGSLHHPDKELELRPSIPPDKPVLLIVEDNIEVTEYLVSALEDKYVISLASNGLEGLEKSRQIIPDIILTDIMMPVMDGFEMIKNLKDHIETDHIPIIIITALGDVQSILEGLKNGADHYLVKPFNEKELLLRLKNVLSVRLKMQHRIGILPSVQHQGSIEYRRKLQFFSKINNTINEHLENEDFGVEDIASNLNMSKSQLYRKFSALTDQSIGKYVRSYRLHKAKEMMEKEGINVTEAAQDTGFRNLSHFSTCFKEEFGYPPSELH
jgi:signal transduction histidine kinase/DNA-binding response OmpR family regulator